MSRDKNEIMYSSNLAVLCFTAILRWKYLVMILIYLKCMCSYFFFYSVWLIWNIYPSFKRCGFLACITINAKLYFNFGAAKTIACLQILIVMKITINVAVRLHGGEKCNISRFFFFFYSTLFFINAAILKLNTHSLWTSLPNDATV